MIHVRTDGRSILLLAPEAEALASRRYINGSLTLVKKILAALFLGGLIISMAQSNEARSHRRLSYTQSSSSTGDVGFTTIKIGDGVYAAVGGDDDPAESNAGFVVGNNGVVVVDSFEDVGAARDLLSAIRKVTNLPIKYVINPHYHLDHVGGNAVFAEAGALILAQRNVRGWERTENYGTHAEYGKPWRVQPSCHGICEDCCVDLTEVNT